MILDRGTKLGPYEILAPLGAGGMGEVYKARDTRLDRIVAIKVSQEKFSERFEREARAVAALNHPNICTLHDVGPDYLVMEFVEGAPLKGPLPLQRTVEYAGQILEALDAAHRKGITHRDLKPANILLTKQGIKLLDFGLAKQSGALQESDATLTAALTGKGQILGTLQYMSPEQLQGKEADPRSDLFSFGCVLYEMISGKRAFEGQSAASVIAAILEREPAPLAEAPLLDRVVGRSLAKNPDQRFQTARDLKAALTWALEQPPASAAPQQRGRYWWIAASAALAIAAAIGLAVDRFRQPLSAEPVVRLQIDPPPGGRFLPTGTSVGGLALSPDGKTAAYVAAVNGKAGLWVKPLDGTVARLLPGTEAAGFPFWSPDSKSIAFLAANSGTLRRVSADGGTPDSICKVLGFRGGSWGGDGYILFAALTSGVSRVSASGGTPSQLTTPDVAHGEVHRSPLVLPGGHFLYWAVGGKPESTGVYAASLARPAERVKLVTTESDAVYVPRAGAKGYLFWLRGETLVTQEFDTDTLKLSGEPQPIAEGIHASNEGRLDLSVSNGLLVYGTFGTRTQFAWFDRTGKSLSEVGEPDQTNFMFRLSPDARRIVVQRSSAGIWERGAAGIWDLWLLDGERGLASRLTAGVAHNTQPVWSPDGRTILYTHFDSRNLFRKAANGVGDEQLVAERPSAVFPLDWSGDGRWVLTLERAPETKTDLWILPMTAEGQMREGVTPKPYLRTPFNETNGRFSPEPSPRWVAFQSDESSRYEVSIDTFPEPRGKKRVSTAGGRFPQWGAGGRELFYVSPDYKLMAVTLKLGADSVEASEPRELFQLPVFAGQQAPYEATRDGQRFLVLTVQEQAPQSLTVIVNWPALLKRGSAAP